MLPAGYKRMANFKDSIEKLMFLHVSSLLIFAAVLADGCLQENPCAYSAGICDSPKQSAASKPAHASQQLL